MEFVLGLQPRAQRVLSPTGYFKLFLLFNYIKGGAGRGKCSLLLIIWDMQMGLYHFFTAHIFVQVRKPFMICKYLVGSPISCITGKKTLLISICIATASFSYGGVSHHLFNIPEKTES